MTEQYGLHDHRHADHRSPRNVDRVVTIRDGSNSSETVPAWPMSRRPWPRGNERRRRHVYDEIVMVDTAAASSFRPICGPSWAS